MKLIRFFLLNALIWGAFHILISILTLKFNIHRFALFNWLYKTYRFEKSGATWDRLFHIKKIKPHLPESTLLMPTSFNSARLKNTNHSTLHIHIDETDRAELTHWLSILPAPLFFLWNPRKYWSLHILYAGLSNLPFIFTQRYNRPRLRKLYALKYGRTLKEEGQ